MATKQNGQWVSDVSAGSIDETYPIAGRDNDTQGFRDNFNYIKSGLTTAKTEIGELYNKTDGLTTEAISDGADFLGKVIQNATLRNNINSIISGGLAGDPSIPSVDIDPGNGNYLVYQLNGAVTFNFRGFPALGSSELTLEIRGDDAGPHTVSFFTDGSFDIKKSSDFPVSLTVNSSTQHTLIKIIQRQRNVEPGVLRNTVHLQYLGTFE